MVHECYWHKYHNSVPSDWCLYWLRSLSNFDKIVVRCDQEWLYVWYHRIPNLYYYCHTAKSKRSRNNPNQFRTTTAPRHLAHAWWTSGQFPWSGPCNTALCIPGTSSNYNQWSSVKWMMRTPLCRRRHQLLVFDYAYHSSSKNEDDVISMMPDLKLLFYSLRQYDLHHHQQPWRISRRGSRLHIGLRTWSSW